MIWFAVMLAHWRAVQAVCWDRRGNAYGDHGEKPDEPVPRSAAVSRWGQV